MLLLQSTYLMGSTEKQQDMQCLSAYPQSDIQLLHWVTFFFITANMTTVVNLSQPQTHSVLLTSILSRAPNVY